MKHVRTLIKKAVAFSLLITVIIIAAPQVFPETLGDAELTILFTHDLHSHFNSERFIIQGKEGERGGYARLKTAIDSIKALHPDLFLFDAGDFSMGTPYQTIFSA